MGIGHAGRAIGDAARLARLGLNDRHAMQADSARARHDAPIGSHQRVDACRQALAGDRTRTPALRGEPGDDGRRAHAAERVPELHRRHDVAAGRIDEDHASQLLRKRSLAGEIEKRLRRILFDHALGDDDLGAFRAARRRIEAHRTERHRRLIGPRRGRACDRARRRQRERRDDAQPSARRGCDDRPASPRAGGR